LPTAATPPTSHSLPDALPIFANSTVHLAWTGSTDNVAVTDYRVTRKVGATTTGTFDAGIATTYDDTTAVPGTAYTYTAVAYDAASNTAHPSTRATMTARKPTS